jgi:tetratricopeptide (TPR) repeat protein
LIGIDHWSQCRAEEAERAFNRSLEHARRAGHRFIESESLALLLRAAFWGPTPVTEGIQRCEEIRGQFLDDHRAEALALAVLAGFESLRGHFELARRLQVEAEATLIDLGLETERPSIQMLAAEIELLAGNPEDAERALRSGHEAVVRMGEGGQLPLLNGLMARVLYMLGRLEEAEQFTRLSEDAASSDDVASGIMWRSIRAKVAARAGRWDEAHSLSRSALSIADGIDFTNDRANAIVDAAEVEELTGRTAEAASLLRRAIALYQHKGNLVSERSVSNRLKLLRAPT